MRFEIIGNEFYRDGKAIKLFSGAVHYFRNMPDTWRDIFKKMKAMGLNCVETYCAWNLHEPKPDVFCFENHLDIARFIKIAAEEGLMVIVRPGPYICAEWEFGGLPWWIQTDENMEIRCLNPNYIKRFDKYLDQIIGQIKDLLCTNGGPVIMLQCENEYGSYGDDAEYLKYLRDGYIARGVDVPLFTSDDGRNNGFVDGAIEGCLSTLNFGSRVTENFEAHDKKYPNVPKMCMEMWNGWFDAWGEKHHTTSTEEYAKTLRDMMEKGSFNIYMFVGGTNFGFMNGANHYETYAPTITSYDYDALLTECGDVTPKYMEMRKIISEYLGEELPPVPANRTKKAYGKVALTEYAPLLPNLENLHAPIFTNVPKNMECYGIGYGYIAYSTDLHRDYQNAVLSFEGIGDRAHVFVGEKLLGILYVNDETLSVLINAKAGDSLTILVENMGRANYGAKMMRKKGIVGRVLLDGKIHFSWNAYPLEMKDLKNLEYISKQSREIGFYKGYFDVDEVSDTFLKLDSFRKGFVIVNGFHLGRYWEIGPQQTLYIPASILKKGKNEVVVFESDGLISDAIVEFLDYPILDKE